ncbi:hypothetical protein HAX54_015662, partial [Datura stramonium]|nr:hypothetical protein [Datura stramonium]
MSTSPNKYVIEVADMTAFPTAMVQFEEAVHTTDPGKTKRLKDSMELLPSLAPAECKPRLTNRDCGCKEVQDRISNPTSSQARSIRNPHMAKCGGEITMDDMMV